jgi:hypothetical protein
MCRTCTRGCDVLVRDTASQSLFTLHIVPRENNDRSPALERDGLWHHWQTVALPVAAAHAGRGGVVGEHIYNAGVANKAGDDAANAGG